MPCNAMYTVGALQQAVIPSAISPSIIILLQEQNFALLSVELCEASLSSVLNLLKSPLDYNPPVQPFTLFLSSPGNLLTIMLIKQGFQAACSSLPSCLSRNWRWIARKCALRSFQVLR